MKYKVMLDEILAAVGEKENIQEITNCMTRLRLVLKDEGKADIEKLKKIKGAADCIYQGGQYQLVLGPGKAAEACKELKEYLDLKEENFAQNDTGKKRNILSAFLEMVTKVFTPIIGILAGSGMIRVLLMLLTQFGLMSDGSQTYTLLYMFSDAIFYFMPVALAYTAAKYFKCNLYVAVALAAILLHPTFTGMVAAKEAVYLFGIPVTLTNYSNSFIPILLIVYLQSWVEKGLTKICPKVISFFAVPMLVILITGSIGLIVLGPLGDTISKGIASALITLDTWCSWLVPALMGACFPLLVLTGTHHGLYSAQALQMVSVGYGTVYIPGAMSSNMATAGAALAVALRSKDKDMRSLASSGAISAVCGITEPALYGVSVKLKTPLISTIIGGGVAGLFGGIMKVRCYALGGTNIFSIPIFMGGENNSFVFGCIMLIIAVVVSFVVSFILYREPADDNKTEVS